MTVQNYCMVNQSNNVCENVCLWDGNPDTWTPPPGYLMLVQATTLARVWQLDTEQNVYVMVTVTGQGQIGFTWDGTFLTTNEPQPAPPPPQPVVDGAQTV